MSVQPITLSTEPFKYKRLLATDITRIPDRTNQRHDSFCCNNEEHVKRMTKKAMLQKIFTVATFGIVGLYIAHRNNLFNPIKNEVKRLLKDKNTGEQIKTFVDNSRLTKRFPEFIKKYLSEIQNKTLKKEANDCLHSRRRIKEIVKLIQKSIKKENLSPEEYNEGIFFDVMEKLQTKLEKLMLRNKKNNVPYKNQSKTIFETLFKQNGKRTPMDDLLAEVVTARYADVINKYLNEAIIKAK